ncbi:MAG TPA: hypothetical protein VEG38_14760 [Acidimicrobiia bacterium]|nr:hypothetical protein [Acidimicrobiia bacterium]
MRQDPQVREEAGGILEGLFRHIGESRQQGAAPSALGGLGVQIQEFVLMPVELAEIFITMSAELTELILQSLAEAGIVLVKGLSPM